MYTAFSSAMLGLVNDAVPVVGSLIVAGLGIFALVWGVKKFKESLF